MPELPEVETVRRTLENYVLNKEIRDIDIFYNKMIRNQSFEAFRNQLIGKKIDRIERYGKHLVFVIDEYALISHLRMEGKYFIKHLEEERNKHEHVIFYFTDDSTLRYQDTRKFGTMDLILYKDLHLNSPIVKLGYEPFNNLLDSKYLKQKLSKKTVAIKSALLDQTIITGLGNIYVDEVLFRCNLNPNMPSNQLKKKDYDNVILYSKQVLEKAINLGGTTIRSYTSSLGVTGRFQNDLLVHTKVGTPCVVCGTEILKTKVNGRGTYYCPNCQK